MRPDLQARRHKYQGRVYWVVKDPVALQYFRFEEEEFAILQMLDGESSLDEVAERFEKEFPPQTIKPEELQQFIGMLHRSGLVLTDSSGQGIELKKRRDERKRKEWLSMLGNILSVRFKGIDPDWLLEAMYPYVRWFFSVPALIGCIVLASAALLLVLTQFDVFQAKLPDFHTFFSAQNWMLLALVLGGTKVLHEFGHGMSCKHFGGECHEMGVMLLVLTPCLYCNVSDSWMLPNRWHRASIGAAGMYVELVLASICTFIWWFSEPGLLNYVCLNVMFVSSVSTLLFNANPLLRYDGYYILSDILEIPNLRQKASQILSRTMAHWCLGIEPQEDPFLPKRHQGLFALYTIASAIYRWVVVLSILYFLNQVFEPYGLKIVGQLIALGAIYGLTIQPLWKLYKFLTVPGRFSKVKRWRMYTTLALLAGVIAAVLFIPLPSAVYCPVEVQMHDAESVYVQAPGTLVSPPLKKVGDVVAEGDVIAVLENLDLNRTIVQLEGEIEANKAKLEGLRTMSFTDSSATELMDQVRKALAAAETQLAEQQKDVERLTLRAPHAGTVMPPDYTPERRADEKQLVRWSGTPFDEKNVGATFEPGTKFCQVGDPLRLEARLAIDQSDVDLVLEGQRVEVLLNQATDLHYITTLQSVARDAMPMTPPRLSSQAGGPIPTEPDASGVPKPLSPYFEAIAPLTGYQQLTGEARAAHELLRVGLVGEAKIHTRPRTLYQRIARYLSRTFAFDL